MDIDVGNNIQHYRRIIVSFYVTKEKQSMFLYI